VLRNSTIDFYVRPEMDGEQRRRVLQRWYRRQLDEILPSLLEKWQKLIGVQATEYRIKKMKTKWGTCNADARRIWLNVELAKKPVQCLEYVLVHELAHMIERNHNDRFISILDKHLPQWKVYREELASSHLAHETWSN
jgi:predicted metal-dependent hydrolase